MKKNVWIAVGVFIMLVAVAWWQRSGEAERGMSRVAWGDLDVDRVQNVTIQVPDQPQVVLSRRGEGWLVEGKRADKRNIGSALRSLKGMESSRLRTRSKSQYEALEVGDAKGVSVTVTDHRGQKRQAVIGKAEQNGTYVRVGNDVFAVKGVYASTFSRPSWRDMSLFELTPQDVARVTVQLPGQQPWSLEPHIPASNKTDQVEPGEAKPPKPAPPTVDGWKLTAADAGKWPEGWRFDRKAAQRMATSVIGLRAKAYLEVDPGPGHTKLQDETVLARFTIVPKAKVRRDDGNGAAAEPLVLHVGASSDKDVGTYARVGNSDEVVTLTPHVGELLRKGLAGVRDWRIMEFDSAKVTTFKLRDGRQQVHFAKSAAGEWQVVKTTGKPQPEDFVLDPGKVFGRLGRLRRLRAVDEAVGVSAAKAGLRGGAGRAAYAEMTLTSDGGTAPKANSDGAKVAKATPKTTTVTLRFGRAKGDNVYAQGNMDGRVYLVPKRLRDEMLGMVDTFARPAPKPNPFAQLDPEALKKLPPEIRAQVMQQLAERQAGGAGGAAPRPPAGAAPVAGGR